MKLQNRQFAIQLKKWIKICEWNDSEVAQIVGVSRQSVSKWLNGHSLPNGLSTIILIDAIAERTETEHSAIVKSFK